MIYLNDRHIREIGMDWPRLLQTVESVTTIIDQGDYVQPLKPYLRYRDPGNRIIAMPAFVGGGIEAAGLKWIAGFPGNRSRGLPRAHNVTILNDPATGAPEAICASSLLSILRTAAVSGLMIREYLACRKVETFRLGIVGWGPIGRHHLEMCMSLFGDRVELVTLYDINGIESGSVAPSFRNKTKTAGSWKEVYRQSDIFITCTTPEARYIDEAPSPDMLLLNISLRDYHPESVKHLSAVIVDDWTEVCRENTDIERLHEQYGLSKEDTLTLADVVCREGLQAFPPNESVFFNPMGLAAFDIGIADYYRKEARRLGIGKELE
ncbi:2,3-diaminopropionate biosynthesis protein SbnB [Paenibacillus tarimensis]